MSEANGNVKWYQLVSVTISLLAIVVTISIFGAKEIIANDRLRVEGDEKISDKLSRIDKNVTAIATKMGVEIK